jgi:hypothetical protein
MKLFQGHAGIRGRGESPQTHLLRGVSLSILSGIGLILALAWNQKSLCCHLLVELVWFYAIRLTGGRGFEPLTVHPSKSLISRAFFICSFTVSMKNEASDYQLATYCGGISFFWFCSLCIRKVIHQTFEQFPFACLEGDDFTGLMSLDYQHVQVVWKQSIDVHFALTKSFIRMQEVMKSDFFHITFLIKILKFRLRLFAITGVPTVVTQTRFISEQQ